MNTDELDPFTLTLLGKAICIQTSLPKPKLY